MSVDRSSMADIESNGAGTDNALSSRTLSSSLHQTISCPLPPPAVGLLLPLSPPLRPRNHGHQGDDTGDQEGYFDFAASESRTRRISRSSAKSDADFSPFLPGLAASETTALLSNDHFADSEIRRTLSTNISKDGDAHGEYIGTTSKNEFLILSRYSIPLIISCLLQYSLTGASVIAIGHLGKTELAAVSLAIMTSNVTGYCAYSGLATSLDTLCAQAYGSGKMHLVGLHVQRMIYLLWIVSIPIAVVWLSGTQILLLLTPDPHCAELAGLFLRILVLGAPGFATFEAGKRFVQAQGLFNANLYVLLFCAPLNAFLNWLFVWVRKAPDISSGDADQNLSAPRMGFRRSSYCSGHHQQLPASLPVALCILHSRARMLGRIHPAGFQELETNVTARRIWICHADI